MLSGARPSLPASLPSLTRNLRIVTLHITLAEQAAATNGVQSPKQAPKTLTVLSIAQFHVSQGSAAYQRPARPPPPQSPPPQARLPCASLFWSRGWWHLATTTLGICGAFGRQAQKINKKLSSGAMRCQKPIRSNRGSGCSLRTRAARLVPSGARSW